MLAATLAAYFLAGHAGRRGGRLVALINRRILNPVILRIAGPLALSVVHHVGRRTGRPYHTPVFAEQARLIDLEDGFGPGYVPARSAGPTDTENDIAARPVTA